ncbi:MAG: repeat protein [Fibrobacteres bacterium]|nr:repeat protein [Fibrobacterota bacterium]
MNKGIGPAVMVFFAVATAARGGDFAFRKFTVSPLYDSEGADLGDLNGDGKPDLVSGPYWYEGPGFKVRHEYQPAKILDPANGYTDDFMCWIYDYDGDGRQDILMAGLPGNPAYWYQNPGAVEAAKASVMWKRRTAYSDFGNESPDLIDIDGDGKREIAFNTNDGYMGWAAPDPADVEAPWIFHRITSKGTQYKFTHGLGFGDVNGDGRRDLLEKDAWWEQPPSLSGDPVWARHAFPFGAGGAQMHAYDVDGDGDNDVITTLDAHGFGLAWFEQIKQNGAIGFTRHMIMGNRQEEQLYGAAFSQLHALALTDIDGDGLKDLVTGKRKWAHGPTGDVEPMATCVLYAFQLQRSAAGATFLPRLLDTASGIGTQLEVKDADGDGLKDILIGNKNGTFIFFKDGKASPILPFLRKARPAKSIKGPQTGYDLKGVPWKWDNGFWENQRRFLILPLQDQAL